MGRVGVEEATTVSAQHLDGLLRGHRAHGQGLRGRLGILCHCHALGVQHRLTRGIQFGILELRHLHGAHILVGVKVLDDALAHQKNGKHKRQRQQQPQRDARDVGPEIADDRRGAGGKAAYQRKHHGNAGGSREEVLHGKCQHLSQVTHGGLTAIALPVGIGDKADSGVEG